MKKIFAAIIIFTFYVSLYSQTPFEKLNFLIGNWQGVESGMAGDGIGFRTYNYDLNENYIVEKNQSTFPKSENKPMGEVHRDFGVFSFNSNTNSIIYRSFNIEGFTNIFVLNSDSSTTEKLVFITREIENNPGNWVAKSTIQKISDNEFIETFEIAMDGKLFKSFLKNHWYKIK